MYTYISVHIKQLSLLTQRQQSHISCLIWSCFYVESCYYRVLSIWQFVRIIELSQQWSITPHFPYLLFFLLLPLVVQLSCFVTYMFLPHMRKYYSDLSCNSDFFTSQLWVNIMPLLLFTPHLQVYIMQLWLCVLQLQLNISQLSPFFLQLCILGILGYPLPLTKPHQHSNHAENNKCRL